MLFPSARHVDLAQPNSAPLQEVSPSRLLLTQESVAVSASVRLLGVFFLANPPRPSRRACRTLQQRRDVESDLREPYYADLSAYCARACLLVGCVCALPYGTVSVCACARVPLCIAAPDVPTLHQSSSSEVSAVSVDLGLTSVQGSQVELLVLSSALLGNRLCAQGR